MSSWRSYTQAMIALASCLTALRPSNPQFSYRLAAAPGIAPPRALIAA